jgi:quinolinate synthase
MRRITLPKLIESLEKEQHEIVIREDIRIRAKAAIDAMLAVRLNKAN